MPAAAAIERQSANAFALRYSATLAAPPARVWAALVNVPGWWSGAHSYSGKAANLSLDAQAGGCWCERWTVAGVANSVEHGRVLMAMPGRTLRLSGAFGPLQSAPVNAVLTFTLKPAGTGTELVMSYGVAGDFPGGLDKLAGPVDGVMGEAFTRLQAAAEGKPLP